MKISIGTLPEYYELIKEIGYDGIDLPMIVYDHMTEVILSSDYEKQMMKQYQKISEAGLEVSQTHMTFWPGHFEPFSDPEAYADHFAPIYIRQIEVTGKMNCRTTVAHLFLDEDVELSRQGNCLLIERLLPALEQNNVILSIENLYGPGFTDGHLTTAEDLLFYMDYFKSPYLGICLDVGHAIALDQDPLEMLKKVKDHLTALHIHTSHPKQDLHLIPKFLNYAEKIDWDEFYDVLSKTNYQGTFNLELIKPSAWPYEAMKHYYALAYLVAKDIVK